MPNLARANSYAAPGDPVGGAGGAPPSAAPNGLPPARPMGRPSAFSSAFSPSRRPRPGGPLPLLAHDVVSSASGGSAGEGAAVMGDVDRLLNSMF